MVKPAAEALGREIRPEDVAPLQSVALRLVRRLRRHSETSLTPSQLSALSTLERIGPMRVGELARREQIQASSVTRIVSKLGQMGYLVRDVDPGDARSAVVGLSDAGRDLLAGSRARANAFLAREVARMSPEDQAQLLAAIELLTDLVNLPQAERAD